MLRLCFTVNLSNLLAFSFRYLFMFYSSTADNEIWYYMIWYDNENDNGPPHNRVMCRCQHLHIPYLGWSLSVKVLMQSPTQGSLEEGIVPSEWKEANITPLFKKRSRNKPENYRLLSLTSVVCKLLETLIILHMVEFLVKHNLINTSQHGFLKARSCLTNLLCFFEEITKWVDDGSAVDVVYLDLQKAFDKVSHQRLLLKLKAHGIGNDVIN